LLLSTLNKELDFKKLAWGGEYQNILRNKKFFIQKLILIFVPLQKIRPRKSSEKQFLKQIFNQQ